MLILDGKKLSNEIADNLKLRISELQKDGATPRLVIIQIGDDSASNLYVKNKINFAQKIGASCELEKFPNSVTEEEVIAEIQKFNQDPDVNGMILQLPIPQNLDKRKIINSIQPQKDVDGLSDSNLSKLVNRDDAGIIPATARGILHLLEANQIQVRGQKVLVIGRSVLVGKSTALNLLNHDATVTIAHSQTTDLLAQIAKADIIVSATGHHGIIDDTMELAGKVVVDVGITIVDGKIVGDANLSDAHKEKMQALSPVPGGVGPMTVASLFLNLLSAYQLQNSGV